jgi:phage shock protein C
MYCPQCGKQVDSPSRFCPACGAAVNSAPPPPPRAYPNSDQITRPLTGRMIGGVCAGFAIHYGWDINLTRIITALLIVCTGVGALAYIAAWVIIPQEPYPFPTKSI